MRRTTVSTLPTAAGFQLVSAPVVVSKAAALLRAVPLTWSKTPPTYSVLPSGDTASPNTPGGEDPP